jgi:hypothetical protein
MNTSPLTEKRLAEIQDYFRYPEYHTIPGHLLGPKRRSSEYADPGGYCP